MFILYYNSFHLSSFIGSFDLLCLHVGSKWKEVVHESNWSCY